MITTPGEAFHGFAHYMFALNFVERKVPMGKTSRPCVHGCRRDLDRLLVHLLTLAPVPNWQDIGLAALQLSVTDLPPAYRGAVMQPFCEDAVVFATADLDFILTRSIHLYGYQPLVVDTHGGQTVVQTPSWVHSVLRNVLDAKMSPRDIDPDSWSRRLVGNACFPLDVSVLASALSLWHETIPPNFYAHIDPTVECEVYARFSDAFAAAKLLA